MWMKDKEKRNKTQCTRVKESNRIFALMSKFTKANHPNYLICGYLGNKRKYEQVILPAEDVKKYWWKERERERDTKVISHSFLVQMLSDTTLIIMLLPSFYPSENVAKWLALYLVRRKADVWRSRHG